MNSSISTALTPYLTELENSDKQAKQERIQLKGHRERLLPVTKKSCKDQLGVRRNKDANLKRLVLIPLQAYFAGNKQRD
jgi:hypothetical protein